MGNDVKKNMLIRHDSKKSLLLDLDIKMIMSQTSLSEDELNDIFEKFISNNQDGKLNRQQFVTLYNSLRTEPPERLNEVSEYVFRCFDTDKNGTIDFKEFIIAYSLTSRGDIKKKLEYAFSIYDADNNGYLDTSEIHDVLFGMFNLFGMDRRNVNINKHVDECLKKLDISGDGKISKEEFIKGLMLDYSLRTLMSPFN